MDAKNGSENEQKSAVKLSSKQAEILLKADLRNLARKVQTGKTLSVAERNLLQSALSGENLSSVEFAKNAVELASILDVDRKTIQRWRKVESNPGVRPDGRWSMPEAEIITKPCADRRIEPPSRRRRSIRVIEHSFIIESRTARGTFALSFTTTSASSVTR